VVLVAGQNVIYKNLSAFKGLDLRTSDILRGKDNATDMNNAEYRQTGAINKRKGYQYSGLKTDGGYGQTTFKNVNTTTGAVTEQIVGIDDNLLVLGSNTFNITYAGTDIATYEMYVKEDATLGNKMFFRVIDNGVELLDMDLGTGTEASPTDIDALIAAVTALTDITAGTLSGGGSSPAAFLPLTDGPTRLNTTPGNTFTFEGYSDISTPTGYTTPFSTFLTKITDADFENASFAQINNILYIATGHDDLHKYDGTRVYKAGMPQGTTPTAVDAGTDAASFTGTRVLRYKITNQYTDAKGNITEGIISSHVEVTTSAGGDAINVTYTELAGSAGYDVDGTMQYNIWRTDDSADATDASLYFLVHTADQGDTIPWKDTGVAEGAEFIPPVKAPGLPPKTRYADIWRGQLILSGDILNVDTTYYSDIVGPEYFPAGDNSFIVDNRINGIKVLDNTLYIFEKNAVNAITGDFGLDNFQVDPASREGIGCVAHHTIQEVQGTLYFLSDRGVYRISPQLERPEFIGGPVSPRFSKGNIFTFKQAVGYNWQEGEKYLMFLPKLPADASYSDDALNETYVYDYFREAWLKWTNFNIMGGISEKNQDLYFTKRILNNNHLAKVLNTGSTYDYVDHIDTINFSYKANWETLGEPSLWKKFLRIKVHSYDVTINDFESQIFSIIVKQEIDWDINTTITVATLDFSGGSSGWGIDPWGEFPWGQARLKQLKRKLMSKKVKSTRMIFENSVLNENVLISGYEMQIAVAHRNDFRE
jgi:hypothetical protein